MNRSGNALYIRTSRSGTLWGEVISRRFIRSFPRDVGTGRTAGSSQDKQEGYGGLFQKHSGTLCHEAEGSSNRSVNAPRDVVHMKP